MEQEKHKVYLFIFGEYDQNCSKLFCMQINTTGQFGQSATQLLSDFYAAGILPTWLRVLAPSESVWLLVLGPHRIPLDKFPTTSGTPSG